MKKWLYVFVITILLLVTGVSAYFLYNDYYKENSTVANDPYSLVASGKPATLFKTEIKDGVIVEPPPSENDPITLKLSDVTAENGKLRGKINLESKADFGYRDILFIAQLKGKSEQVKSSMDGKEIIVMQEAWPVAEIASDRFSVEPREAKVLDFEMDYPKGAVGEDYTLSVRVGGADEFPIDSIIQEIKINPLGGFLTISQRSCKIDANNLSYEHWMGPNINPGEKITGSCEVVNKGNESISARPYIRAAERFVTVSDPIVVNNLETVTWGPGETKTVTFELPPQNKPQTYQAIMQLVDRNNQTLSTFAPFRYVVRGASAVVRSAQLKSIIIDKGEEFEVEVFAAPSVDLFWRTNPPANTPPSLQKAYSLDEGTLLKNPRLVVSVNSGSTVCGEKTVDMPLGVNSWETMKIQLKALEDCKDPIIEAKVLEGDTQLAQYQKKYISPSDEVVDRANRSSGAVSYLPVILVSVFLVLIIIVVASFLLLKKKSPVPPVTGLVFVLASVLAIYSTSALVMQKASAGYDVLIAAPGTLTMNKAFDVSAQFFPLDGGGTNLYYSNGAVFGIIQQNIGCPACINCVFGYYVEILIDGGNASIDGAPGGYYMTGMTTNSTNYQNMTTGNFRATRPGIDLSVGTHTVEARTVAVEFTNYQISARSTGSLNEGGDHNCGMTDGRGCYGRVQHNFGVNPVGTITKTADYCVGNTPYHTFTFSANVGGVLNYHMDRNNGYIGSSGAPPPGTIQQAATTGVSYNYTVRVQTAQGTYGGSNTVSAAGITCTNVSLSNTSNTCSVKPNSTLTFNFTSNNPGSIQTYYLDRNGTNVGSTPGANPNITISTPEWQTASYTARAYTTSGQWISGAAGVNVTSAACPYGQYQPQATCASPNNGNVRISWEPFSAAAHYRVIYSRQSTGVTTTVPAATTGTYLDITAANGLNIGEPYAFIVLAYNSADQGIRYSNEGNWSNAYFGNTIFPDCRPPQPFSQTSLVSACGQITSTWNLAGGPTSTYRVRLLNSTGTPDNTLPNPGNLGTVSSAVMTAAAPWNLQLNNYYTTMILATNPYGSTYSDNTTWFVNKPGGSWNIFPNCAAPGVVVRINNNVSTVTPTVNVNQNSPAVIDWTVTNSASCTVSSNPVNAAWNATGGAVTNPSSGSLALDTTVPGNYSFTRQCSNGFTGAVDSKTINLNVIQYPRPFIQTTGGDIHTNETINIAPNNP